MKKKGFALIVIIAVISLIAIVGVSGYTVAKNLSKTDKPRKFEYINKDELEKEPAEEEESETFENIGLVLPSPSTQSAEPSPLGVVTVYKQPQGKFIITLPKGWLVESVTKTTTYTTSKFTNTSGYITITFGTGKDPPGGCSETSNIELLDRTIDGCYLLQKDGSQLLSRGYTKDSSGQEFTIEGYINPPLSPNKPIVLSVVKTIDIN